jgi:hypothetical protein
MGAAAKTSRKAKNKQKAETDALLAAAAVGTVAMAGSSGGKEASEFIAAANSGTEASGTVATVVTGASAAGARGFNSHRLHPQTSLPLPPWLAVNTRLRRSPLRCSGGNLPSMGLTQLMPITCPVRPIADGTGQDFT